jgi:hypothetical protein
MPIIGDTAKLVKDISIIVGAVVVTSSFFVNTFPDTKAGVWLSAKYGQLFNVSAGSLGFIYYEVGPNGSQTEDGRLIMPAKSV